jgi:hypothetical protein
VKDCLPANCRPCPSFFFGLNGCTIHLFFTRHPYCATYCYRYTLCFIHFLDAQLGLCAWAIHTNDSPACKFGVQLGVDVALIFWLARPGTTVVLANSRKTLHPRIPAVDHVPHIRALRDLAPFSRRTPVAQHDGLSLHSLSSNLCAVCIDSPGGAYILLSYPRKSMIGREGSKNSSKFRFIVVQRPFNAEVWISLLYLRILRALGRANVALSRNPPCGCEHESS